MPVVTTLTREAMPLIRYAITDRLSLEYDHECPCGRKAPIVHHEGRDVGRFAFGNRMVSMADLEERVFRLPIEAVSNVWMIVSTPKEIFFRVEAYQPDPKLYKQLEDEIARDLDLPLRIDPVELGGLFPIGWLLEPARVGKPSYHCEAESLDAAPQSLPELWMGPEADWDEDSDEP